MDSVIYTYEEAPGALALAVIFAEKVRDTYGVAAADLGDNAGLFEEISNRTGGSDSPALIAAAYQVIKTERDAPQFFITNSEQYKERKEIPGAEAEYLNALWHDVSEDGLAMNMILNAVGEHLFSEIDTSTGDVGLVTPQRVLENIPASYYQAVGGLYGGVAERTLDTVGGWVGTSWSHTFSTLPVNIPSIILTGEGAWNGHELFKSDLVFFEEGTKAHLAYDAAKTGALARGLNDRDSSIDALKVLRDEDFGISMFGDESVVIDDNVRDVISRDLAYVQHPFENYVDGNLGLAMQEVLVAATRWARGKGAADNAAWANVDFGDMLDQGRLTIEAVENFDPNNPQFQIFLYPTDLELPTGRTPLFYTEPNQAWSYSGQADRDAMRSSFEFMRENGIESQFLSSILGVGLEEVFGGEIEGSPSKTFEALRTELGGEMTPLSTPQMPLEEEPPIETPIR